MKITEQAPDLRDGTSPQALVGNIATTQKLSVPALMASAFGKFDIALRARLLSRLLGSVGPLALTVVGGGVFAKYLRHARWSEIPVSFEDATRATSSQVYDLVRYVEQCDPQVVAGLLSALSQDGATMTAVGASIAAIAVARLLDRNGPASASSASKP